MSTTAINGTSTGSAALSSVTKNDSLGKQDFLNLLVTQLKNQDPTEPLKNEQLLAQMAQFSQLETTQNMATMQTQTASMQAAALLGMHATAETTQGVAVSGIIDSVKVGTDGPLLDIGGQQVTLSELQGVSYQ